MVVTTHTCLRHTADNSEYPAPLRFAQIAFGNFSYPQTLYEIPNPTFRGKFYIDSDLF